jgi:hypothetical protein
VPFDYWFGNWGLNTGLEIKWFTVCCLENQPFSWSEYWTSQVFECWLYSYHPKPDLPKSSIV